MRHTLCPCTRQVYDSIVNQLLSIMDGVSPLDNVLLIGMTNRVDLIDPALIRPGRFEVNRSPTLEPDPRSCLEAAG